LTPQELETKMKQILEDHKGLLVEADFEMVKEQVKEEVEVIDKLLEIKQRIDNGGWNRLSPKEARYWYDNNHLINDLVIQ